MTSQVDEMFCLDSIVRGQHVYKTVWTPFLGEILTAISEPENNHDRHAVCVEKGKEIVGHVPRKLSLLQCGSHLSHHAVARGHAGASGHARIDSSPHPLKVLLNAASIRGRLLNGVRRPYSNKYTVYSSNHSYYHAQL